MNLKHYYHKEKKIIQDNISKFKKQDIFKSFFFFPNRILNDTQN